MLSSNTKNTQKPGFNFFSSLPSLAYDIEDNPLFARLKEKARKLSGVPEGALKAIFIADDGSRVLRLIRDTNPQRLYKSGAQIIEHFLAKSSVDAVCVFSPSREAQFPISVHRRTLRWSVSLFCRERLHKEKLETLAAVLPAPRFDVGVEVPE